jgi:ribosome-associated protein
MSSIRVTGPATRTDRPLVWSPLAACPTVFLLMTDDQPTDATDRDEKLKVQRSESNIRRDPAREARALELAVAIARLLHDDKCEDVQVLDLRGRSQVTDYFVIASGTSQRQMRSAGLHAQELGEGQGFDAQNHNLNDKDSTWFILDFIDVVTHIFEHETRLFYDIEMLWGDAEAIEWRRPEDRDADESDDRNRAGLRSDDVLPEGGSG